jgi:preprotein translocase subunit YajC
LELAVTVPVLALLAAPREGGNATMIFLLQMVAIGVIFYMLLIRPQRKEQERHKNMIQQLKKGDEVVTNGGIIGTVVHAQDDRLTIKTAENTRIVVQRGRIAQLLGERGTD